MNKNGLLDRLPQAERVILVGLRQQARAPFRNASVSASARVPGWDCWKTVGLGHARITPSID
jgi:hypothetical protein